ncbi:MAG: polysaccharide biosynthesis tyrosine autokinase, partial [Actinomycetota bacterium]|nr:polysaccharide biosynthesis tyrosine autokinase [Actinomycetota bacterium]
MSSPPHDHEAAYAHGQASPLREQLAVLRARRWWIAVITLVTVASGLFFSYRQTPIYEAQARVLVAALALGSSPASATRPPNLETQRELVASFPVATRVATELGLDVSAGDLLRELSVSVAPNTEILVIHYAHPSAEQAGQRAQGFADAYLGFRREQAASQLASLAEPLERELDELEGQLSSITERLAGEEDPERRARMEARASRIRGEMDALQAQLSELADPSDIQVGEVVIPAVTPTSPAHPRHGLNGALSLALGLTLGVGLAFVRERLDDRPRGRRDLELVTGTKVMAVIPRVGAWRHRNNTPLTMLTDPRSGASEAYRTLRTAVLFAAAKQGVRTILITSAHEEEGKTSTTSNLAVALAQAGKRVVVVSADLRKPRLHRFFEVGSAPGITNILADELPAWKALQRATVENLRVLASGPIPANPAELLGSDPMRRLLDELAESADIVLVDSAPVLAVADPVVLAPLVDAVLLVADAQTTTRGALSHAREQLDQMNARILGAILNNFDPAKGKSHPYYYQYYYTYQYEGASARNGSDRAARPKTRVGEEAAPKGPDRE